MLNQTTYAERAYNASCAETARTQRQAAEACNEILTLAQADFVMACIKQNLAESFELVERLFDQEGWPNDDLDTAWLDEAGRVTWAIYRAYRSAGAV